jgi:hypothetical protein
MPKRKDRTLNSSSDKIAFFDISEREARIAEETDIFIQKLPTGTAKAQTHSPKARATKSSDVPEPVLFFK